ncbi:CoA activase [Candidatus Bipolaricaulota bacterium]|nr:CoA activase [Candidatus Bipolaricaulota bacterium]
MFYCGCDLGSATGKAVIIDDDGVVSSAIAPSTTDPSNTATLVIETALGEAGLTSVEELECIVGTGYGRRSVPFRARDISEISCHAYGAFWLNPRARTVVDIGGQDCKVISLDGSGRVLEFAMNDKCAAGTGRFFEAMARAMDCTLEELEALSLSSSTPEQITSQCSVFAESEVITLIYNGSDPADIAAGIHDSIAGRLHSMIYKVGTEPEIVLSGGGAISRALARSLEQRLGLEVAALSRNPQIVGALGAALYARDSVVDQQRAKPVHS